jgi:hypothetical protein
MHGFPFQRRELRLGEGNSIRSKSLSMNTRFSQEIAQSSAGKLHVNADVVYFGSVNQERTLGSVIYVKPS